MPKAKQGFSFSEAEKSGFFHMDIYGYIFKQLHFFAACIFY